MTTTIAYCKHGLGNIIMMTPALRALAALDPSGKIDVCLDSAWEDRRRDSLREFFGAWDIVADVIEYPKTQFFKEYKTWFFTRHAEYSQAFDVFASHNKNQTNMPNWDHTMTHEIDFYMAHVRRLGFKGETPGQWVPVSDVPRGVNIGLCNGGFGALRKCKAWPYFPGLARALHYYYPKRRLVGLGWENEMGDVRADDNLAGTLSFLETIDMINSLALFITTDTALMHVADALRVPTIAIFGGSLVSKNGPVNGAARVVRTAARACSPCQTPGSWAVCEDAKCLDDVSVGEVMAYAKAQLR